MKVCSISTIVMMLGIGMSAQSAWGQQPQRSCGTMHHLETQLRSNPTISYRMREIEQDTRLNAKSVNRSLQSVITIPVVVHVLYRTPEENLSISQILSQIAVLNEDFRRRNADISYTRTEYLPVAADPGIEFKLAQVAPDGRQTTGITRTRTSKLAFSADLNDMKYSASGGVDAWPTDQYLNIWICNLEDNMLGYAQFPGGAAETDGVVIGYRFFGTTGTVAPPFNLGRTATHEVGHWLNLRHIWGDGPCDLGDFVEDTPPIDHPNHGCPDEITGCEGPAMTENFMDYTDDACMNLFTQGQTLRMRALFGPGGTRASLLNSPALLREVVTEGEHRQPPVLALDTELLPPSGVRMSWTEVPGATAYNVRLRMAGGEWAERSFPKNNTVASRLKPCTEYEFQVEAVIEGTPAGYSPSRHFTTLGCEAQEAVATVPENLRAVSPTDASVTLTWTSVAGATGYQVQYKIAGQPTAQSQTVTRNGLVLKGLRPETLYLWRVRAVMGASQGPYAPVADFSTSGQLYASSRVAASPGWMTVSFQQPGIVELSLATTLQMQVDISLLDASQTLIKSWTDRTVVPGRSLPLQVMGLPAGTYYLVVRDVSGFETIREVYIEG